MGQHVDPKSCDVVIEWVVMGQHVDQQAVCLQIHAHSYYNSKEACPIDLDH